MSDYLTHLAQRALGVARPLQPFVAPRFAPPEPFAKDPFDFAPDPGEPRKRAARTPAPRPAPPAGRSRVDAPLSLTVDPDRQEPAADVPRRNQALTRGKPEERSPEFTFAQPVTRAPQPATHGGSAEPEEAGPQPLPPLRPSARPQVQTGLRPSATPLRPSARPQIQTGLRPSASARPQNEAQPAGNVADEPLPPNQPASQSALPAPGAAEGPGPRAESAAPESARSEQAPRVGVAAAEVFQQTPGKAERERLPDENPPRSQPPRREASKPRESGAGPRQSLPTSGVKPAEAESPGPESTATARLLPSPLAPSPGTAGAAGLELKERSSENRAVLAHEREKSRSALVPQTAQTEPGSHDGTQAAPYRSTERCLSQSAMPAEPLAPAEPSAAAEPSAPARSAAQAQAAPKAQSATPAQSAAAAPLASARLTRAAESARLADEQQAPRVEHAAQAPQSVPAPAQRQPLPQPPLTVPPEAQLPPGKNPTPERSEPQHPLTRQPEPRSRSQYPSREAAVAPEPPQPTIRIHIGRVELRGAQLPAAAPPRRLPPLSLGDFLKQQRGGQ